MSDLTIGKILETRGSSSVFTVPENTSLYELSVIAADKNVGALLIASPEGRLIGIVSERDILREVAKKTDFQKVTAADIMVRQLVTVSPDDDVNRAMDLMINKKIRHLPVMQGDNAVGLITVRDLLLTMRKADEEEIRLLVEYLQSNLEKTDQP